MEKKRLAWLDALKGIGILLVMASHADLRLTWLRYITAGFIPLFFIASGFTFSLREETVCEMVGKKAKRLLLPYFVYGSFFIMSFCILRGDMGGVILRFLGLLYGRFSYKILEAHAAVLLPGISPLWFLPAMFTAYIMFFAVLRIIKLSGKSKYAILLVLILLQLQVARSLYLLPWCIDLSVFFSLCIYMGYKSRESFEKLCKLRYFVLAAAVYIVLVAYNGSVNLSVNHFGDKGLLSVLMAFAIGMLYTYCVACITKRFESKKIMQCLAWVGRQSLRLMCIHMPCMGLAGGVISKSGIGMCLGNGEEMRYIIFVIELLFIFAALYLLNVFLKHFSSRLPILRYL